MSLIFKDKGLRKQVFSLAIPFFLQEAILVVTSFLTALMFNPFQTQEVITGVGTAGNVYFMFSITVGALVFIGNLFISQHYGKGKYDDVEKDFYLSLKIVAVLSIIFFVLAMAIPSQLISIFIPGQTEAINFGTKYLRIFAISLLFNGFSLIYYCFMKNTGLERLATINSLITLVVLASLNGVFIFGVDMGLEGIAASTVIARGIEMILNIVFVQMKGQIKFHFKNFIKWDSKLFKEFFKRGGPLTLAKLSWATGFLMISVVLGQLVASQKAAGVPANDAEAISAANALLSNAINIVMSVPNCVAPTVSVIVGRQLGANKLEDAKSTSKQILRFTTALTIFAVVAMMLSYPIIFYTHSAVGNPGPGDSKLVASYLLYFTIIVSCITIPRGFNGPIENGILTVGGDNLYVSILDAVVWTIPVGLGFIGVNCGWHPIAVFACLQLEEVIKCPINFWRYKTNKWVKNIVTPIKVVD
ncbi:MAG: polysaccharide biosynthesis C-terminal domain-containing protein [Bacilli bacterium]|nr:polysaccharide biosynthesis C-terminal domain-containing protein [Bacilli bacterium]